ncbi:MAG: hypothetical protein RDV48_21040 [Candidatus Eremiobacteraeota bacterium]|nr:hypothetical protein [Candidatus Eremiobacteraeota bacterium]
MQKSYERPEAREGEALVEERGTDTRVTESRQNLREEKHMSGRFEEYYVRRTERAPDPRFMEEHKGLSLMEAPAGTYVLLHRNEDLLDFSGNECRHYSLMTGEAIYTGVQENVGAFHYEHWKEGALERLLSYNSDYFWHKVEGTAEEWESKVLFTEEGLRSSLQCYDEEFHERIRQAWEKKEIKEGDQFPPISETEAYQGLLGSL